MSKDAGVQAVEFFLKRAEYSATLAAQHCRDKQFDKGMNLYKEAYGYLKKADAAVPENADIKSKLEDVKIKYQDAKKMCENPG